MCKRRFHNDPSISQQQLGFVEKIPISKRTIFFSIVAAALPGSIPGPFLLHLSHIMFIMSNNVNLIPPHCPTSLTNSQIHETKTSLKPINPATLSY
jgi:hypothetical protein